MQAEKSRLCFGIS